MSEKQCKVCEQVKPLDEFHRNCKMRDGRLNECKPCLLLRSRREYQTPGKRATAIYSTMKQRERNSDGKNPTYADVEIRISRDDFIAWFVASWPIYVFDFGDRQPSIDRINGGHYEFGNIRLIPLAENSRLALGNHNVHAPDGMAWCGTCETYKLRCEFHKNRCQVHGLCHQCKPCESKRNKLRRATS